MDEPYSKLLFLLVPAFITALLIICSPIIEEKKFKNSFIGKTITVSINITTKEGNEIEIYRTNGHIDKITDETLEIKRKFQPKFKVPFDPKKLIHFTDSSFESDFFSKYTINSKNNLNENKGLIN